MKKILLFALTINIAIVPMVFGSSRAAQMKTPSAPFQTADLSAFLTAIQSMKTSFFKHSQVSNQAIQGICDLARAQQLPSSKLKKEVLQKIKKTQNDVDAFKTTAISFQNSNNVHVQKLSEAFITLYKYATAMLKQQARFVSAPEKFSPSDGNTLVKYTSLFGKQCKYIDQLINEVQ